MSTNSFDKSNSYIHCLSREVAFKNKHSRLKKSFLISVSDPYHLAGSGSASGNVDLDPGTKKKS